MVSYFELDNMRCLIFLSVNQYVLTKLVNNQVISRTQLEYYLLFIYKILLKTTTCFGLYFS